MKKAIAMMLVLMMALTMVASAEKLTPSKGFKLPAVKHRPVVEEPVAPDQPETPADPEAPVEPEVTEAPAEPEVTEAPVEPEVTEAPAEPETDKVIGKAFVKLSKEGSNLNVRTAASKDAECIGSVANGTEVEVLGYEGDWAKVNVNGMTGYVMSSYLEAKAAEPEMPEVTDAPVVEEPEQPEVTDAPVVEETEVPEVTEEPVVEETVEPEVTEEPVVEVEYLTDAEGNVLVDGNGNPIPVGDYLFDENGAPVFDLNGNVIPFGNYQVDENGALIFDENGMPIPVVEEEVVPEVDPLEGLRQIMVVLHEGEMFLPLYAEPNAESSIVANIPAGEILYVKDVEAEWSYAVYGELEGYVLTSKIALYNEETTPEEEEIIRSIKLSSNVDGMEAVYAGTTIVMTAQLVGFENDQYSIQWKYSADNGATMVDIEGATGLQYSFVIDDSNAHYIWSIVITIADPVEEEVETPAEEVAEAPAEEAAAE